MSSRWVPLTEITVPAGRIREVVSDLAPSLQEHGQLMPILVYFDGGRLVLKDGLQRLDAARRLGWERIWAVEVTAPSQDSQGLLEQYEINHARTGLSYLDQARVWQALMDAGGWTQAQISRHFKVSTAKVSLALATLNAHPDVQDLVNRGRLAPSAVRAMLPLPLAKQQELAPAASAARTVQAVYDLVRADEMLSQVDKVTAPGGLESGGLESESSDFSLQDFNLILLSEARDSLVDIQESAPDDEQLLQYRGLLIEIAQLAGAMILEEQYVPSIP